ncbi:MAG: hypothetical protein LBO82_07700 [Synergistaceae bacterium]|jgi:hypothetical protein|nr:hypothetical protein [Synergistaceae bacterium]
MERKNVKKCRWILGLALIAAISGASWAEDTQSVPQWVYDNIFGHKGPQGSVYPKDALGKVHFGPDPVTNKAYSLVGGYVESDDNVKNRTVTIQSNAVVAVAVIGAATATGSAEGNSVTINGGTIGTEDYADGEEKFPRPGQVYGGYVTGDSNGNSGNAEKNTVAITGGTIKDAVVGGFVQGPVPETPTGSEWNPWWATAGKGNASDNTVTITGGKVLRKVFGGRADTGDAAGNKVTLNAKHSGGDIVGGSSVSGNAKNNTVEIKSAVAPTADGTHLIAGGVTERGAGKTAEGNKVIIEANVTTDFIYGGRAGASETTGAKNNSVQLKGGTIKAKNNELHIYGGLSAGGAATGNEVVISGGTKFSDTGTVNLHGGQGSSFTGNRLVLDKVKGIKVTSVANFNTLDVILSSDIKAGNTILTTSAATFADTNPTFIIDSGNVNPKAVGSFYLIKANALTAAVSSDPVLDRDGKSNWKLEKESDQNLKATFAGTVAVRAPTFADAAVGYVRPEQKKINVAIEPGAETSTVSTVADVTLKNKNAFDVIKVNDGDLYIQPKAGLPAGTYSDTITVTTDSPRLTGTADVTFTVTSALSDKTTPTKIYAAPGGKEITAERQTDGKTYLLSLPAGTDTAALRVSFDLPAGARIFPASGSARNFSKGPVTYTVTAEDKKTTEEIDVAVKFPPLAPTEKAYFSANAADCRIVWSKNTDGTVAATLILPFADDADTAAFKTGRAVIIGIFVTRVSYIKEAPYLKISFTAPSFGALNSGVLEKIEYSLEGDSADYVQTFSPGLAFSAMRFPKENFVVRKPDKILSVEVRLDEDGNEIAVITYEDETRDVCLLDMQEVVIGYPEGKFSSAGASAFAGDSLTVTAKGILIPAATPVRIIAKPSSSLSSSLSRSASGKAGLDDVTGRVTASEDGTKTILTVRFGDFFPSGRYDLTLKSPEGANPSYTVPLVRNFEVKEKEKPADDDDGDGDDDDGDDDDENDAGTRKGGGGCDAGFGSAAFLLFAAAALARKSAGR